jgi:PAS domain S-box-containing protein
MLEFFHKLFYSDFMSHGHCYFWKPEIVWLHAISDAIIALSYYLIPVMLVNLVRKRRDLPFHWVFIMFGLFILSCGTTHAMEIWTLWHGTYRLAGLIKAITAGASIATAIALVPLVPKALQLASPAQLQAANLKLEAEIAERMRVEEALQTERDFVSAVLNTVGTIIVVLDAESRVVQCNQACEQISGWRAEEMRGRVASDLFAVKESGERFLRMIEQARASSLPNAFEKSWTTPGGDVHVVSWTTTTLAGTRGKGPLLIAAGVDITEAKVLEKTVLEISGREQRRIGQDLHDGLGQHLTGIAFMSKALEQKLAKGSQADADEMANIVKLVNEGIDKTRELSRGLLPVSADSGGLMTALEQWSSEIENRYGITCIFTCAEPVLVYNDSVATHAYRIAQEAVNNAVKHAHPTRIDISLIRMGEGIEMRITDNGVGLSTGQGGSKKPGLGLRIMNYRAKMMGATVRVERRPEGGTMVTCQMQPGNAV